MVNVLAVRTEEFLLSTGESLLTDIAERQFHIAIGTLTDEYRLSFLAIGTDLQGIDRTKTTRGNRGD